MDNILPVLTCCELKVHQLEDAENYNHAQEDLIKPQLQLENSRERDSRNEVASLFEQDQRPEHQCVELDFFKQEVLPSESVNYPEI